MTDPHPDDPQQQPASIWQPLDGSAPRLPTPPPVLTKTGQWAPQQPHPQHVAATYAATQQAPTNPYVPQPGVYTLSDWGPRAAGFIVDMFLFGALALGAAIPVVMSRGLTFEQTTNFFSSGELPEGTTAPGIAYAALFGAWLILGLLPAISLTLWNGQTPGKRIAGTRVMTGSGAPLTFTVALRREVVGRMILVPIASFATFSLAYVVNYVWPLWDVQRRTGHDVFADTRVVMVTLR